METVFSTRQPNGTDEFLGFWNAIRTRFQPIELERLGRGEFRSELRQSVAGPVSFTHISCDPVVVKSGVTRTGALTQPQYLVRVQLAGRSALSQYGRSVVLDSSEFTVLDPEAPYTISNSFGAMQCLIVGVDSEYLDERLRDGRPFCARRCSGESGPARVALTLLSALSEEAHALRKSELDYALRGAMTLLVPELVRHRVLPPAPRTDRATLRVMIERHIDANLADPSLCPQRIAQDQGISVRYLYKLFEGCGLTVAEMIRSRRLKRCRDDLLDPARAVETITRIAYSNGFSDAAHFSRVFRQEFGMSPRDLRERGVPA